MFKNIKTIDLATSGASYTITQNEMVFNAYDAYYVTGTRAGFTLTTSGTVDTNSVVNIMYVGTPTGTVDILGKTLASYQQTKKALIEARYNGSSWDVVINTDSDALTYITNAEISATADIAITKLDTIDSLTADTPVAADLIAFGDVSDSNNYNKATFGDIPITGDITGTLGATTINPGAIVNADVNAAAAIAYSKLATLNTGQILAGNAGVPTAVTMSGDATISATGVVTIPDLLWEQGAGTDSVKDIYSTTGSGNYSITAGRQAVNTSPNGIVIGVINSNTAVNTGIVVGRNSVNSGQEAVLIGSDITNNSTYGIGIGHSVDISALGGIGVGQGAQVSAAQSSAFGNSANSRIETSTNISGPIFIRKSDATANANSYQLMSGAEVIIMTEQIDAEATDVATITLPTGVLFFLTECGTIATSANTVAVEPTISFGITGNNSYFAGAAITTALTAAGTRERITSLSSDSGVTSLTAEITVAATATTLLVRHYFRGFIVENQ
jgi:hypothetical protein